MRSMVEMKNISKAFPGVQALNDVSFDLKAGEIVGLAGANGAGKSTLLKILTGVFSKDEGEIILNGNVVHFKSPEDSKKYGIAAIYQELTVIPNLSVSENIFIKKINTKPIINYKKYNSITNKLLEKLGLKFKAKDKISSLTVANQQMVEIARAINEDSKILIMDEPTSALTSNEKEKLFSIARDLKQKGIGIIFVTHRLKEIFEICDRVSVMKDGKMVGTFDISQLSESALIEHMISKTMKAFYPKQIGEIGDVALCVEHIKCGKKVKDVSFEVRAGEIFGLTGLLGSGRSETARCIFGLDKIDGGTINLYGKRSIINSPYDAVKKNIALVPEDRKEKGLVLNMSITGNICLGSGIIKSLRSFRKENKIGLEYIKKLGIVSTGGKQIVEFLSGGNQQKVVIAKWLLRNAKILILDEPTKGIDIAAKAEIHALVSSLAVKGTAVILISSEQEEIINMCDRAVVLYEGVSVGTLNRADFSEEKILNMSHNKC